MQKPRPGIGRVVLVDGAAVVVGFGVVGLTVGPTGLAVVVGLTVGPTGLAVVVGLTVGRTGLAVVVGLTVVTTGLVVVDGTGGRSAR